MTNKTPDEMAVNQAVVDGTPLPSVIARRSDGIILCFNTDYAELVGIKAANIVGRNVADCHLDRADWGRILENLASGAPIREQRLAIQSATGETVWAVVAAKMLGRLDEPAIICSYFDISEEARRASTAETRLIGAIEQFSQAVVLFDAEDRLVASNQQWRSFSDKVMEATKVGTSWKDYFRALLKAGVFPEAIGQEDAWLEERARLRHDSEGPIEVRRSDGMWTLVNDQKLPDGSTLSIATDITKQKHAEEALQEREQRFRDFTSAGSDWFWETDANHRFTEAWLGETIYPESQRPQSLGKTRYENTTERDREAHPEKWQSHLDDLENHRPFRDFDYPIDFPDRRRYWVRTGGVPVFDKAGEFMGYRGVAANITATLDAEERARTEQQQLASAIDSITDMIAVWDPNAKLVVANRSFFMLHEEMNIQPYTGMSYEEYIRSVVAAGMYPELEGREDEHVKKRLREHHNPGPSIEIGLFTGARIIITNYLIPKGGLVIIATDITELKTIEKDREALREQLHQAQKMETIGTLAGGIAHDFNNILAPILGHAEMALDKVKPSDPSHIHLESIENAALRAAELVQQMLTFSRHDNEERRRIDLVPIVAEALNLFRAAVPATIDIEERLDPTCPPILANSGQIHQIILNLCTNAAQAMSEGQGSIKVSLSPAIVDTDSTLGIGAGFYAELCVTDNGPGIDAVTQARIFDPFFTTKDAGKGTGLGLSVVHGIVLGIGGHIAVDSAVGRGARFTIHLPALESTVKQTEKQAPLPVGGRERILLIDDETAMIEMGEQMLGSMGYHVQAFTNGLDALAAFGAAPEQFDLAITDKTMPDMTGEALAEKLLRIRGDLPIIMVTGFGSSSSSRNHHAGISDLVSKPFTRSALDQAIRKTLGPRN